MLYYIKGIGMTKKIEIREVDYGIGSYFGSYIEINKHLPPDLRKKVLDHELSHTERTSWKEFISHYPEVNFKFWWWMIKHPKSFYNFFPYRNGYLDIELCIGYTILGGLICLVWIFFMV